ncbi:MAG: apolipoprotein N-acyltransferase [Rickettsiales bacterium]|nr:apolipoprotein N-acyltransferase [Rickettsiales bacterium]
MQSTTAPRTGRWSGLFCSGLASSLAFAPLYLFFIFFFSLNLLLESLDSSRSSKEALLSGWIFGFGYFMGNCYWFYSPLLVEPVKYAWLIPFALTLIPSFLACYIALTTLSTWLLRKFIENRFYITVVFAIFWTVFEIARGILATGFAWNLVGYSLAFCPLLLQTVSIFGSHLFGFLLLILYSSPYPLKRREYRRYSVFYCSVLLLLVGFGLVRLKNAGQIQSSYLVRLVQPNLAQEAKMDGEQFDDIVEDMLNISLEGAEGIDYIVWPETALPHPISFGGKNRILQIIGDRFGKSRVLVTGALRIERACPEIFNSLIVIRDSKIVDYYDKYHLAPFGEFIPFSDLFTFLTAITGIGNFSRARVKGKLIEIDSRFPIFSPSICYESIFIDSVNRGGGARLIVNVTNDAWLGRTSGPYQHFNALRFRALESHMPAIRVANSGISGVVDKYGRVLRKTKLGRREVIDVRIPLY